MRFYRSNEEAERDVERMNLKASISLPKHSLVRMKNHYHTLQYLGDKNGSSFLTWDSYFDCEGEGWEHPLVFSVPTKIFRKEWKRSLNDTRLPRGYFDDEMICQESGQIKLFESFINQKRD